MNGRDDIHVYTYNGIESLLFATNSNFLIPIIMHSDGVFLTVWGGYPPPMYTRAV